MAAQVVVGLAILVGLFALALMLPRRQPASLRDEIERENLARLRRHAIFAPPPHAHDGRLEEVRMR